jgi:hypothetical protein
MWPSVIRLALAERERLWEADPLPPEWSPETFAKACRRTALQILEGARRGWGKPELAEWLTGPYERLAVQDEEEDDQIPQSSCTAPFELATLLDTMRADLIIVLGELTTRDGLAAFGQVAVTTGLVALSRDVEGIEAFVPRARRRMTLVERVMSLVAVDALVNPMAYERELVVCPRCATVVFDPRARIHGACLMHVSGVMTTG